MVETSSDCVFRDIARRQVEASEEALRAKLIADGGVEGLVALGRSPSFNRAQYGNERVILCVLPPEGAQYGDEMRYVIDGGTWLFVSSDGVERGSADVLVLTPQEAEPLIARLFAAQAVARVSMTRGVKAGFWWL